MTADEPSTSGGGKRGDPGAEGAGPEDDTAGGTGRTGFSCRAGFVLPTASDVGTERERITRFIRRCVDSAAADGVVVAMSGGVDSTVAAALAVEALGPERVYGLVLPCTKLGEPSARDAETLAGALGIEHDTLHLQPLFAQFGSVIDGRFDFHDDPILAENVIARLRTALSSLAAEASNRLVCGTANRTDRLLGEVAGDGDRTADLSPVGHLYGTDVRALGERMDLPEFVTNTSRRSVHVPGYVEGLDLDMRDERIDEVLYRHVDGGLDAAAIAAEMDANSSRVSAVLARYRRGERRRRRPNRLDTPAERQ